MFLARSHVDLYLRFDVLTGVNVKFVLFLDGASCSLMGWCVRTYAASHSIRNLNSVDLTQGVNKFTAFDELLPKILLLNLQ
jgi:hypothetical protein